MGTLDKDRRTEVDRVLRDIVKPARWPAAHPVTITARHLPGEPERYADALAGPFVAFEEGGAWGTAWGTTWFHVTGTVPDSWSGLECVLAVHLGFGGGVGFGAEGQVWVDGEPIHGISPNHREVRIAAPAVGGEAFDLYVEAAANPPALEGDPGPMLLPEPGGEPRLTLRRCRLTVVDREVEALVRDWMLVGELDNWAGGERAGACGAALDRAATVIERAMSGAVDTTPLPPEVVAEVRAIFGEVLASTGDPDRIVHLAVGNSHLDTAWLWPLRETHRKAARTFSTACTTLDREPEYTFAASQPQQLAWIRDEHPELWQRIKAHVADGRFDVVGAMWIEPDCNVPSGESLVRQIVHGRRFFQEELGTDTDGLWLPDVFGYSAALPQILRQSGVDWFMTQKISWNQTNRFPHQTFWWEGIDGTRIFTHFPPADTYNGDLSVPQLQHGERNLTARSTRQQAMYLYGHGDGGGGPDQDMIERARRLRDLDGVGKVELTTAREAMQRIRAEGPADNSDLPVWVGELYLELHRGTFTTQGAVKRGNRELELALRDAELWSVAAASVCGNPDLARPGELDGAWRTVLLHQFHDILPGSSINWVYRDTLADYDRVRVEVATVIDRSLAAIANGVANGAAGERGESENAFPAGRVLVANPLPWARHEVVEVGGQLHFVRVPACGWAVHPVVGDGQTEDHVPVPVTWGDDWIDNGILRVSWDADGLLTSVRHLPTGREALAAGERGNMLQLLDDRPKAWDAWDIDVEAFATAVDLVAADVVELIERSPLRAVLRVVRTFGSSSIEQLVRLDQGSRLVEVHCDIDWHEDHKLLKVAFPLAVHTATARHEIQFGHVERPTHRNTSWDTARFETCAQTWVDLSEEGFGVALLNDCKYGHDVLGSVLRLSLLRSPTWPDPVADRGRHTFAYALCPHAGPPTTGGVIAEAHAFNSPLRVVAVPTNEPDAAKSLDEAPPVSDRWSAVAIDDPGVVIAAFKPADDGLGTILRFHEAFGGSRRVTINVPGITSAARVDPLEVALAEPPVSVHDSAFALDLRPFELVTLRLR